MNENDIQLFIIVSSLALILLITLVITLFLFFQKKKIQYILNRQNREATYKEELLQAQIDTNEQSLQNVGRELHDNIGQLLSIAKMKLSMMLGAENSEDKGDLQITRDMVSKSLNEIRQLSKSLNNTYIGQIGFIPAIEAEIERINRLNLCNAQIKIEGRQINLNVEDELSLYRIIQESISNTLKHAAATMMEVALKYSQNNLYIHINDNGVGFEDDKVPKGTGLLNIERRVKLLSAKWTIESDNQHGTKISIIYPIKRHEQKKI